MTELHRSQVMAEFYKQLDQELKAHLDMLNAAAGARNKVVTYLVSDLTAVRFSLQTDQLAVSDLWKNIRSDESILDLVLDLTISMRYLVEQYLDTDWDGFLKQISEAVGVFHSKATSPAVSTLEDDGELERFVTDVQFYEFMQSNPWLATLFIIRRLPHYRSLCEQHTAQAAARG